MRDLRKLAAMVVRIACDQSLGPIDAALAARGIAALAVSIDTPFADAVLLAPGAAPLALVTRLRGGGWTGPLMLLVERPADVIAALDAGADEAVPRATDPAEIAARLTARLRERGARLAIGTLVIDPLRRDAMRAGRWLGLLPREYALLAYLARHAGRAVPRTELLAEVWKLRFDPGTNVVQAHVSRLRRRLDLPGAAPMLTTERGKGYRLVAD
jgi:two-component system, OmpR family, response regulator